MDKLTSRLVTEVVMDEIKKSLDIVDGFNIHVKLNGDISIKLMHSPSNEPVLAMNIIFSHARIEYMVSPLDYVRYEMQNQIEWLREKTRRYRHE